MAMLTNDWYLKICKQLKWINLKSIKKGLILANKTFLCGSYWVRTSDPLLVSCCRFLRFSQAKAILCDLYSICANYLQTE